MTWHLESMRFWQIPVPPTSPTRDTLLCATSFTLDQESRGGNWQRRVSVLNEGKEFEAGGNLIILIDDATRSYGAALQSPRQEVSAAAPLTFMERWELSAQPGRRR